MRRLLIHAMVAALLVAACSDSGKNDESEASNVVMAASELEAWENEVVAFFGRFYEGWPDLEARFSEFADDAVFYDPTFGDYWVGPEAIHAGWGMMPSFFPELEAPIKSVFLSAEGAAFSVDWVGFWLGSKPLDVPWPAGLEVFRFDGDVVASQELWYTGQTLEGDMSGCEGCSTEFQAIADRYVAAWSSGDANQIADLYANDATLSDSMFGIDARGAEEISLSVVERFGSGAHALSIQEVYGVTLGRSLIPSGSPSEEGAVTGVGIRYQWTLDSGERPTTVDSLTLLHFGNIEDGVLEPAQESLIVSEEVFHNPDTLIDLTP